MIFSKQIMRFVVVCHFALSLCWTSTDTLSTFCARVTKGFATLIREWPGDLYNNMAIVQAVNDHLKKDQTNRTLLTTLAEL